ncbi:MAG TPA: TolC family outer membrane protein [Gammaproteobacteria bacterium]|nr:TolC family outer membrane protein [Gammaproteobacteria bacterium]
MNRPEFSRRGLLPALMLPLLLVAAAAQATDLSESVTRAQHYDPTLQASNYAAKAGKEGRNQATALYLPQISLIGEYQRVWSQTDVSVPPNFPFQVLAPLTSVGNVYGYGVTLTQPLYSADVSVKAAQLRDQASLAEVQNHAAQQDLVSRVSEAYFNVIVGYDTLRYVRAEKAAVAEQLASAKARFQAGRTNITDVQDAEARYDAIIAQEIQAENNLAEWNARYQRAVGVTPDKLLRLPEDFQPTLPDPNDMNAWIQRGLAGNLDVQAKRIQQQLANKAIDLYTFASRPQLGLVASYSDTRQSGDLSFIVAPDRRQNAAIGLQLSIPIFSGGALVSQLREARATSREATYDLQAAQADVTVQIREVFQSIQAGVKGIQALEQAAVTAKTSLEANQLALKVGVKSTQDVLNAEQTYYQTLEQLEQARYQYLMGMLSLQLLVGGLDDAAVARINQELHSS